MYRNKPLRGSVGVQGLIFVLRKIKEEWCSFVIVWESFFGNPIYKEGFHCLFLHSLYYIFVSWDSHSTQAWELTTLFEMETWSFTLLVSYLVVYLFFIYLSICFKFFQVLSCSFQVLLKFFEVVSWSFQVLALHFKALFKLSSSFDRKEEWCSSLVIAHLVLWLLTRKREKDSVCWKCLLWQRYRQRFLHRKDSVCWKCLLWQQHWQRFLHRHQRPQLLGILWKGLYIGFSCINS